MKRAPTMARRELLLATLSATTALAACAPAVVAPVPVPQPPAKEPPPPSDPEPVVDGDVTVAYENGLRILVKRVPGAELAAIKLVIKGGSRTWTKANAGVEQLALRTAVEGGTRSLDKDAFSKKLVSMGSELGAASLPDYSVVEAKTLLAELDTTFALLAEAFLHPAMPASELELGRKRQLTAIRRDEEMPDGKLALLTLRAVFEGHPYENRPIGTVESVTALTAAALEEHLASLRVTSRLQLVVVGDVSADRVRELARAAFGALPRGRYDDRPLPAPSFASPKLHLTEEKLPTTYVQASFVGPRWSDPDFAAGIVAMKLLGNRVWEEVRTKRNLSYAPSAQLRWGGMVPRGALYVTAVEPTTTMRVMFDEVRRLKSTTATDAELAGAKAQLVTTQLLDDETTDGQAGWLALTDVVGGDWRLSRTLPERMKQVTAAEVQAFANARVKQLQTVVLGDASKIERAVFESI